MSDIVQDQMNQERLGVPELVERRLDETDKSVRLMALCPEVLRALLKRQVEQEARDALAAAGIKDVFISPETEVTDKTTGDEGGQSPDKAPESSTMSPLDVIRAGIDSIFSRSDN